MTFSSDFDPDRIIRTTSRTPKRPKLTTAEIKRRAEAYAIQPPSAEFLKAYRLTATAGVLALMHYQQLLGIAPRTIRKYVEIGLLERLPDFTPKLRKVGLTYPSADMRLYTMGPVGHALAEMESIIVPSGYDALYDRVTHDFLTSYVVIRFLKSAQAYGFQWQWRNRYQATIPKGKGIKHGIEPDAAVLLTHPHHNTQTTYLFEFHNEDHKGRVFQKLDRYRQMGMYDVPREAFAPWWGQKPVLLVATSYFAPLREYLSTFIDPRPFNRFLGFGSENASPNYLPSFPMYGAWVNALVRQVGAAVWLNLRDSGRTNVFTGETVPTPAKRVQ
jgi:hypothetical protein